MGNRIGEIVEAVQDVPLHDAESKDKAGGTVQPNEESLIEGVLNDFEQALVELIDKTSEEAKAAMGGEDGWYFRGPGFLVKLSDVMRSVTPKKGRY